MEVGGRRMEATKGCNECARMRALLGPRQQCAWHMMVNSAAEEPGEWNPLDDAAKPSSALRAEWYALAKVDETPTECGYAHEAHEGCQGPNLRLPHRPRLVPFGLMSSDADMARVQRARSRWSRFGLRTGNRGSRVYVRDAWGNPVKVLSARRDKRGHVVTLLGATLAYIGASAPKAYSGTMAQTRAARTANLARATAKRITGAMRVPTVDGRAVANAIVARYAGTPVDYRDA